MEDGSKPVFPPVPRYLDLVFDSDEELLLPEDGFESSETEDGEEFKIINGKKYKLGRQISCTPLKRPTNAPPRPQFGYSSLRQ